MKKRVLSMLMTLALCLTLLPTPAWAEETDAHTHAGTDDPASTVDAGTAVQTSGDTVENPVAEVTIDGTTMQYADIDAAFAAAQQAGSATVKLLADVTISHDDYSGIALEKGNITLDLNGKTLSKSTGDDSSFFARNTVFWLSPPGATTNDEFLAALKTPVRLTVQDSSADGNGKIVQPNGGPAVIATLNTILTVNGGTIENTSSVDHDNESNKHMTPNCAVLLSGGGKAVINGGTLRGMRGVTVAGYITKEQEGLYKEHFGIEGYNNDTYGNELTVTDGNICATSGEALIVYEKAKKIELSGGTFTTQSNYSIWVADTVAEGESTIKGDASSLLASGYRYEYNGTECAYSEDGKGVAGNATVAPRPANEYAYIDKDGKLTTQANCTEITEHTDDISTSGWYVVKENLTISSLNISGEVDLILCDEATLTVSNYMNVTAGSTLNLFWQSAGSGKLTAAAISVLGTVTAPAGEMKQTTGEGGTTFEKCFEHDWGYTNNGDTHTATCKLCGKAEAAESHKYDSWAPTNANTHTGTCACGATKTEDHTLTCTPNADGLTHSTKCSVCGYTVAAESHDFNLTDNYGKKCACGAYLAAECNGQQYATLARAIEAAKDGGTVTLQAATVLENITIEDGTNVTIDLNGKIWTLDNMNGAVPVLTVTGGSVTVKNGTLMSGSTSYAATAVEVEGGKLTVGEDMTIQGGMDADRQFPAIDVKGGELTLSEGTELVCGMRVPAGKQLKDYLPAGTAFQQTAYDQEDPTETAEIINGYVQECVGEFTLTVVTHTTHNMTGGACACGLTCAHETVENGVCTVCKQQMKAKTIASNGAEKYYLDLQDAFAGVADGGTVTMLTTLKDDDTISFCCDAEGNPVEKTVTFMMNGNSLSFAGAPTLYVKSGKLIIGDEATISQPEQAEQPAVFVDNNEQSKDRGTLEFKGKASLTGGLLIQNWGKLVGGLKEGTIITSNGTYSVSVERSETYSNVLGLLGDGLAFAKKDHPDELVNGNVKKLTEDVVVVPHTHSPKYTEIDDPNDPEHTYRYICDCGFVCPHDRFTNSICDICHAACTHDDDDGDGKCTLCGAPFAVRVNYTDSVGVTRNKPYMKSTDQNGNEDTLQRVFNEAENGSTVTLLMDGLRASGEVTGKTITLELNGKTINSGSIEVGRDQDGKTNTSGTLKITGSGSIAANISVGAKGTLDLTGWTGEKIWSLTVQNGGKATLNGGTFATLSVNGAAAGSLLASGYAFQNVDTGAYVEYSSTADMENVKVVKCPHSGVTLKADHTGAKCKYCGASFAATLNDAPYDTIDAAVTDWLKNGGTLKLYADYTAADGTWEVGSGSHTINLNGHRMSVKGDGAFFKPTNNMHLTVTDGTEVGQIENILLDGNQRGSFTLESGYVGNLEMTGGAVVTLKGGRVDKLDVQENTVSTNLSIQGGSIGQLNIEDWAEGMHVSATGGSLGAYTLPSGKILADVLDHQYYATGTSLDKQVDTAQSGEEFVINQAPHDFGSTSKAANVPINGSIPFMVDSPSGNATGYYDVMWYRRTDSGAEHMTQNRVAGVNVGDKLDVFCVITGADSPGGEMKWQVAVKGYTLTVAPADLSQGAVVFKQVANDWGAMGNIGDGKGTFVFTPYGGNAVSPTKLSYLFDVYCNGRKLTAGSDYTITGGNTAAYAGKYTLTIEGRGNYTGTATHQWEIKPYTLSKDLAVGRIVRKYDGTTNLSAEELGELGCFIENLENRNSKNPSLGADLNRFTIRLGAEDFEVSNVKLGSAEAGDTTASFTIKLKPRPGQTAANFVFEDGTSEMTVKEVPVSTREAFPPSPLEAGELNVANDHAGVYTLDLSKLLPKLDSPMEYGKVTYALDTVSINGGYYDAAKGSAEVKDGKLILPIQAVETSTESNIGTVTVKVTSGNIIDFPLLINVDATNKIVPTGAPTLSKTTLAWGEQLSTITLSGTMTDPTDSTKTVKGKFEWVDGTVKPNAGSYEAAWKFTPTDGDTYIEADGTVTITVTKDTPTGDPIYTRLTSANQTLQDAALKPNTSWPTGTIQWVDKDGKELPDTTEVKANTAYKWIFTPTGADADNYTTATGELTLYSVSTGGGGGGGSSSGSTVKTDTTTKPDGTKVQTETRADGTKIQTETKKDGSTVKTTTNPNGSSVTESKDAAGSTGTVKTDKNGQTEAKTALSSKAIEDAKKSGEPVKAPVEVKATRDSDTAPTVKVELPKGAGETKVEIPVSNVKPGTVAVLVHADGTEEIVKNSLPTEDGIQLTVNGGATVKIVDNSKDFIDTRNHWAKDAIDFVSARGLVNGMNDSIYAPNASTTRAQLWTILARQNDADLNGGNTWYEKAQLWSKNKGISDGTQPDATITRAQMVTMLWRTMGQPAAASGASFADVPANSYYAQAVAWAVENGITAGVGGGRFDPNSTCTRAQIAAFLTRLYAEK